MRDLCVNVNPVEPCPRARAPTARASRRRPPPRPDIQRGTAQDETIILGETRPMIVAGPTTTVYNTHCVTLCDITLSRPRAVCCLGQRPRGYLSSLVLKCMKSMLGSSASMVCFERASVVRIGTMPPFSPSTPQIPPRVATRHWMPICGHEDRRLSECAGTQAGRLRSAPRRVAS